MKRLLNICLLAIGVTSLFSCEKETTPQDITPNDGERYSISVDFAETRVALDEQLYASWVDGDQIAVETENGFVPFTLSAGAGSSNGVFTGDYEPKNGGYIIYPYDESYTPGTYTFPSVLNYGSSNGKSYPNGISSDGTKFYSFVPMVGKINYNASTKELNCGLRYASGAIKIKYSKLSQDAKGLEITMDKNIAGDATLSEKGGLAITNNASKTLTVKFNDESNGFPQGISFIVPIPAATYNSMSIRVTAKNNATVPGTSKSINGKAIKVEAGHIVPFGTLEQVTPPYIFTEYTNATLEDGEYILVYDPNNTDNTVVINGDDGIRESMKASLDPEWGEVQEGKTVVLDYADYLTGAWILKKNGNLWTITNQKAKDNNQTWRCTSATHQDDGYWYLKVTIDGRTAFNPVHYYHYQSNEYRPKGGWDKEVTVGGVTYKVYEYGVFTDAQYYPYDTNIKLYKLKE